MAGTEDTSRHACCKHGSRKKGKTLELSEKLVKNVEEAPAEAVVIKPADNNIESQLEELQQQYEASCKEVHKSEKLLEKTRTDLKKKTDQVAKLEREHYRMEGKIKHLEYRVSEVDKAEIEIDNLQKQLDTSQSEVREKEIELRQAAKEVEGFKKELKESNEKIRELEEQMVDLKLQVIEELKKNDHIEQLMDSIPVLKGAIKDKDEQIEGIQKQLHDKSLLLQSARKNARDAREKIKEMDGQIVQFRKVENELNMAKCETSTLKSLMVGKDTLVIQKSQALDFARGVIEALDSSSNNNNNHSNGHNDGFLSEKIDKIYDRLKFVATYPQNTKFEDHARSPSPYSESPSQSRRAFQEMRSFSEPMPSTKSLYQSSELNSDRLSEVGSQNSTSDYNGAPRRTKSRNGYYDDKDPDSDEQFLSSSTSSQENKFFRHVLKTDEATRRNERVYSKTQRTRHSHGKSSVKTAVVRPNSHMNPFRNFRNKAPSVTDEITIDLKEKSQPNSPRQSSRPYSAKTDLSSAQTESTCSSGDVVTLKSLTAMERDQLTTNFVKIGDRVIVKLPVKPAYTRKRDRHLPVKYQTYHGIVKFMGTLDKEYSDHRLHVGLRMDAAVGDTDGEYKGKRYFYVPEAHGRLIRLAHVVSVLNIKDSKYHNVDQLLKDYLRQHTSNSNGEPALSECDHDLSHDPSHDLSHDQSPLSTPNMFDV